MLSIYSKGNPKMIPDLQQVFLDIMSYLFVENFPPGIPGKEDVINLFQEETQDDSGPTTGIFGYHVIPVC